MTVDEAKAQKATLERTLTEALQRFNTETGLQVIDVDIVSTQVLLPSY